MLLCSVARKLWGMWSIAQQSCFVFQIISQLAFENISNSLLGHKNLANINHDYDTLATNGAKSILDKILQSFLRRFALNLWLSMARNFWDLYSAIKCLNVTIEGKLVWISCKKCPFSTPKFDQIYLLLPILNLHLEKIFYFHY